MFPRKHHPGPANYSIVVFERHQLLMQQRAIYGTQVGVSNVVYPGTELQTDFAKV